MINDSSKDYQQSYSTTSLIKQENFDMPSEDFTPDEVVQLCCEISIADNLLCRVDKRKRSLFKRSSSVEKPNQPVRKTSHIAQNLSLVNGIPCMSSLPGSTGALEKYSQEPPASKPTNGQKTDVERLDGRNVVSLAILCDENGTPFRTYTENQNIPLEEFNSTNEIIVTRVPIKCDAESTTEDDNRDQGEDLKSAASLLLDLDTEQRLKLLKKLDGPLAKLHTTDFKTASSFLKTDRYTEAKQVIKTEMINFLIKESKVTIV
ncbi:uncharacterized protein LOC100205991 isoform X4 [Hydra vulgaris]|uniref:Uncharacterized protein LOC100205991 isoform X4 n=2 Tax=Hydra vulgaris TaxID=6087 RepID=A0ABM4CGW0_HYDVU